MNAFAYRDGALHAEEVALADVAAGVGTPFYCYATAALVDRYRDFADALGRLPARICYALKANANLAVVRTLAEAGAGADVVSEGELRRALAAGVAPSDVVFSGVGKTRDELAFALEAGIGQFNVESRPELALLHEVAVAAGRIAPVALRVNPDIDAGTHDKIATGRRGDKFGIDFADAPDAYRTGAALDGIDMVGLAVHIGSQLTSLAPFRAAFRRVVALARALAAEGYAVRRLDFGGGLGIPYDAERPPGPAEYAAMIGDVTAGLDCALVLEPGRALVGPAGVMVTRVLYVKDSAARRFVIVDGAMNDLLRPALYQAYHGIVPVAEPPAGAGRAPVDVVGPVCETGDGFARARPLPPVAAGDLLAIEGAGAYGAVMASGYNGRPLVPEVLVKGGEYAVVRPRPDHATLLAQDRMPHWLQRPRTRRARRESR